MSENTQDRHERRSGGDRWARTVGVVAPVCGVALPQQPMVILAPALDGRVVLRREATEDHCMVKDWRLGQVFD